MNSLIKLTLLTLIFTKLIFVFPVFATGGKDVGNGGQSLYIGNNAFLRDIVERNNCIWRSGKLLKKQTPTLSKILKSIDSVHWLFKLRLEEELHKLKFCFTENRLPPLSYNNSDDLYIFTNQIFDQPAINDNGIVFIDKNLYQDMNSEHQAFLILHEVSHEFFNKRESRSQREPRLREFIMNIHEHYKRPIDDETFNIVLTMVNFAYIQANIKEANKETFLKFINAKKLSFEEELKLEALVYFKVKNSYYGPFWDKVSSLMKKKENFLRDAFKDNQIEKLMSYISEGYYHNSSWDKILFAYFSSITEYEIPSNEMDIYKKFNSLISKRNYTSYTKNFREVFTNLWLRPNKNLLRNLSKLADDSLFEEVIFEPYTKFLRANNWSEDAYHEIGLERMILAIESFPRLRTKEWCFKNNQNCLQLAIKNDLNLLKLPMGSDNIPGKIENLHLEIILKNADYTINSSDLKEIKSLFQIEWNTKRVDCSTIFTSKTCYKLDYFYLTGEELYSNFEDITKLVSSKMSNSEKEKLVSIIFENLRAQQGPSEYQAEFKKFKQKILEKVKNYFN